MCLPLAVQAQQGGLIRGAYDQAQAQQVGNSQFAHGTQEVVAEVELGVGTYTLIPSTFEARHEAAFVLSLLYSTPKALHVTPLVTPLLEAVSSGAGGRPGAARQQGPTGPPSSGSGKNRMAPPAAKYDVAEARKVAAARRAATAGQAETEDDGKMGYAEKMEMEELARLGKWKENVPMMTIEGQPLSDTVKKWAKDLTDAALAQVAATGRKFEDQGFPQLPLSWNQTGFPAMQGPAQGSAQPQVYGNGAGEPVPGMAAVTHWRRPEEMGMQSEPKLFKNDWEVEGIIQSPHLDNRWFISALNIVAGNRDQLDRLFMCDYDHKDKGFFVLKFYMDDPKSDDDWAVVLVDDRIPCDANGLAAFCRNKDPSVYWAMIVEKAYAKLSGSYEAMQGGTVVQGLEDLTGGVGYKFDWEKGEKGEKGWIPPKGETPDKLWDEIMEKMKTEHVVGCANNTKGQPKPKTEKKGVLLNRAYAVVTGGEFEQNKLLKLRVPLDENGVAQEWNGAWSDSSSKWNSRMKQMLSYGGKEDDGSFWIEYNDFCKHYNKLYMARMLDDLWTRFTVKSRWMDETAGGCTNFISWRHNNQWLLHIKRPATKLIIKLTQPDARKKAGNGRHYSNALGFYIFKGNEGPDQYRRKLVLKEGDEEDGGDFVFTCEPRFTRQQTVEYTFEQPSATPYVLVPFLFEPGREDIFRFTILCDDKEDDGIPDFGFQEVKPEQDWKRTTLHDSWSRGGAGNQLGPEASAGGPPSVAPAASASSGDAPAWSTNWQFQITISQKTRCFVFLEPRGIQTDMRETEGLQTEPAYPTVGLWLCASEGDHVKLEGAQPLRKLGEAPLKRGDGVHLEFELDLPAGEKYVVLPFMQAAGLEHKYAITCYTDHEATFEKIIPKNLAMDCVQCGNPTALHRVLDKLEVLERKYQQMLLKEQTLVDRGLIAGGGGGVPSRPVAQNAFGRADANNDGRVDAQEFAQARKFVDADADGDGVISSAELAAYTERVQEHAQQQHAAYTQQLAQQQAEADQLRAELAKAQQQDGPQPAPVNQVPAKSKSSFCVVQ